MDDSALLQALLAIRRTCAQMKVESPPAQAITLDTICIILAKQIADLRDRDGLKDAAFAAFGPRLKDLGASDFDDAFARLQQALRSGGASPAQERDLMRLAADAGLSYSEAYEKAVMAEIAETARLSKQNDGDDRFDAAALRDYLVATFPSDKALEVTGAEIASRGFSKKTMLVTLSQTTTLPPSIALRIDRPYNFLGTSVVDEYVPLKALFDSGVRVPRPYALEATGKVLGAPFIVFERITGATVGNNLNFPPRNLALARELAECLVQIHRMPLDKMPALRGATGSIRDGVAWEIEKSYEDWRKLDVDAPVMEAAFKWLRENIGASEGARVVLHGDYNFNNILIRDGKIAAVVDWEFVHAGNPASDLGWFHYGADAVAGWDEFLRLYADAGGTVPGKAELDYYILLAQTRFGTMTWQTDHGFEHGLFDDIRFGQSGALITSKLMMRIARKLQSVLE